MTHVRVTEFDRVRVKMVPVIKDIRDAIGLNLKMSKAIMDCFPSRIPVADPAKARQLAKLLNDYDGCECVVVGHDPGPA